MNSYIMNGLIAAGITVAIGALYFFGYEDGAVDKGMLAASMGATFGLLYGGIAMMRHSGFTASHIDDIPLTIGGVLLISVVTLHHVKDTGAISYVPTLGVVKANADQSIFAGWQSGGKDGTNKSTENNGSDGGTGSRFDNLPLIKDFKYSADKIVSNPTTPNGTARVIYRVPGTPGSLGQITDSDLSGLFALPEVQLVALDNDGNPVSDGTNFTRQR